MNVESWLALVGENKEIAGALAVAGLVSLIVSASGKFKPLDDFSRVDIRKVRWTEQQSDRFFSEKEAFQAMLARGDNGITNSISFIIWSIALLIVFVSGAALTAVLSQSTASLLLAFVWLLAVVLVGRWTGYKWRVAERYQAFRDSNELWMMSRKLRRDN